MIQLIMLSIWAQSSMRTNQSREKLRVKMLDHSCYIKTLNKIIPKLDLISLHFNNYISDDAPVRT